MTGSNLTATKVLADILQKEQDKKREHLSDMYKIAEEEMKNQIRNIYLYGQHVEVVTMDNHGNLSKRDITKEYLASNGINLPECP